MAHLDTYLQAALQNRASDLHIASGEIARMRVDGDLVPVGNTRFSAGQVEALLFEILSAEEREKLIENKNLDKSYIIPELGNFRVNIYFTRQGMAAAIRTIPSSVPTLASLGLPETVSALLDLPKGLILVTGPTGSGKSTTLAAMIEHVKRRQRGHILTIEDPIEFIHESDAALVSQREIGSSCHDFADALKYALREDPDVILVGEMRDLETISMALTAAETGHLVLGTLHTRGASQSIDRILDSFPSGQQPMIRTMLADSLVAVISQVLLKRADGKGRVAGFEFMIVNHAISNLIREGKTFQIPSTMQTARKEGMLLLTQNLRDLIAAGLITKEEAAPYLDEGLSLGSSKRAPETRALQTPPRVPAPPSPAKPSAPPPLQKPASPFKPLVSDADMEIPSELTPLEEEQTKSTIKKKTG